jgi:GAF domain-containing protein
MRLLEELERHPERGAAFRLVAMQALSKLPGYDWSGIYRMENDGLALDEFVGAPTEHTQIPVGVGVCGRAVKEDRNILVNDVRTLDNYLSCSLETRSEIVVLIRRGTEILGQIDVDGHSVGAFDRSDEQFLEALAKKIAVRW